MQEHVIIPRQEEAKPRRAHRGLRRLVFLPPLSRSGSQPGAWWSVSMKSSR